MRISWLLCASVLLVSSMANATPVRLLLPVPQPWSVTVQEAYRNGGNDSLIAAVGHGDEFLRLWSVNRQRRVADLARVKVGFHPDSVRWLDWNGDGRRDALLVSVEGAARVQVWRYALGRLQRIGEIGEPDPARTAQAIDLDGDGHLDLVLGPYDGKRVTLLWGGADDHFTPTFLKTLSRPSYPVVVDWNRDGRTDVAWSDWRSGDVRLALNLGQRRFHVQELQPAGRGAPRSVTVGDIDGDGWPDLIVPQEVASAVKIFYNNQASGVGRRESIPVPVPGVSAVAVHGCGEHSLLALSAAGTELLARRAADGQHWLLRQFPVHGVALDPQFADVDGDGHPDLVFVNAGSKVIEVVFGPLWEQAQPVTAKPSS